MIITTIIYYLDQNKIKVKSGWIKQGFLVLLVTLTLC